MACCDNFFYLSLKSDKEEKSNLKIGTVLNKTLNLFSCQITNIFINLLYQCDKKVDCPNGEDETNCTYSDDEYFFCDKNKNILYKFVCDNKIDCLDQSDEKDCGKKINKKKKIISIFNILNRKIVFN